MVTHTLRSRLELTACHTIEHNDNLEMEVAMAAPFVVRSVSSVLDSDIPGNRRILAVEVAPGRTTARVAALARFK